MFHDKPCVFEAPTVHRDDIESLPSGATVLADNDMGLQAATFSRGPCCFWGVQSHPEYGYPDIAAVAERYGHSLIDAGLFANQPALTDFVAEMRTLAEDPCNLPLLWKHALGPGVSEPQTRCAELRNWLDFQVLPRSSRAPPPAAGDGFK